LKLNFTCTAFIPEIDENNPQGAEHFLYYYKGDTLEHIIDREVRARVQTVAAEFTAQFPLETLRGTQHKLADAVRADVVPFFKKRGISVTNVGLSGGFHYVNKELQKAIDDAIKAQQLKVTATAQQEKEKVEQQTRLQNQEITNKTLVLEAAGQAAANIARAEGDAKAKLAAANVDAEAAKVRATGEAAAIRIEADAEAYKYQQLEKSKDVMIMLKNIELERAWRSRWTGAVPSTVIQGGHSVLPIFPMNLDKNEHKK
jgi:regulator of protease activity HflC (stomatin/prohibitin superfamily)